MCIKPYPYIYTCLSCKWSKKISPKSDALNAGEVYVNCPVCGSTKLDRKEASSVFDNLLDFLSVK